MIELNFPGTGWLRLDRDVLHALARYQAAHGLTGWDETITTLLASDLRPRPRSSASMTTGLDQARTVADAVLYEGYLLYPYRATSAKNQVRWQFGVLGPPGAAADGLGEDDRLATQCLLHAPAGEADARGHRASALPPASAARGGRSPARPSRAPGRRRSNTR